MDISGISGAYAEYYSSLSKSADATALSKKVSSTDPQTATDDELMDVCKQFEAYLLEQVFKNMQNTVMKANEDEDSATSSLVDYFKDQTLQTIASESTESNSLGIAQALYEQMRRNYGISPDTISVTAAENGAATPETAE